MNQVFITSQKFADLIDEPHDSVVKAVIEFGQYTIEPLDEICTDDGFELRRDFSLILAGHFGLEAAFAIGSEWRYADGVIEQAILKAKAEAV